MKLFFHLGFHRTGTHTIRFHLWEKHPQINYLGRKNRGQGKTHFELTQLISNLNNDDFDKRYNELLKKAEEIKLVSNKTNLISDEVIWAHSFHYPNNNDNYRTLSRFVSRTNLLFTKINVDVNFFYVIRNQADVIKSQYSRSAPEVGGAFAFNGEALVEYLKNNRANQPRIESYLSGLKYFKLYKNISDTIGKNKVCFFLYEKLWFDNNKTLNDLSNYLKIDPNISIKLLKDRREDRFNARFEEKLRYNTAGSIIFNKLKKNLKNRDIFFENFAKKLYRLFELMFIGVFKYNFQHKKNTMKIKDALNNQLNIITDNKTFIKKYYRDDCLLLKNECGLDIDKHNYI